MLLYIHIPFCRKKCAYCSFFSQPYSPADLSACLALIKREADFWAPRFANRAIDSVYIGGGTPSLLSSAEISSLIRYLEKCFPIPSGIEFTIEANPESFLQLARPEILLEIGINRLSLGFQSLDNDHLTRLGRSHTREQALAAFALARRAGFPNISLDLIWGLPGQTVRMWLGELEEITALGPEHLSCYCLTLEPDTPLALANERGEIKSPDEEAQEGMFLSGASFLEQEGYRQYEISNFARPGCHCRHNQGYWAFKDYLGLGPGAVSTIKGKRWENPRESSSYESWIATRRIGSNAEELSDSTRFLEEIMLCLRTTEGFEINRYTTLCGRDFQTDFQNLLDELKQNGLCRIEKGRLILTRKGLLLSNEIIEQFLPA
ncbi:MAG: radical SAM family heme chaperone HemW [Desulfovibrionales bacterium]